jgi:hypothetical protein
MKGEIIEIDPRFLCGSLAPEQPPFDVTKVDYSLPTTMDVYKKEHGNGFNDLAWDIIYMFENKVSNNDFKRQLKRYHAEHKKNETKM